MPPTLQSVLADARTLSLTDRGKLSHILRNEVAAALAAAFDARKADCAHTRRRPHPYLLAADECQDCGKHLYDARSGRRD